MFQKVISIIIVSSLSWFAISYGDPAIIFEVVSLEPHSSMGIDKKKVSHSDYINKGKGKIMVSR